MEFKKIGKKLIDNICPPMAFRPRKNNKNILSRIGRKSEGKMGVSDGVWAVSYTHLTLPTT